MTDDKQWQAPGAESPYAPSSAQPPPPTGQPVPPAGAPGGQPPPPSFGAAPPAGHSGWTPPPKPGLIPLRPLEFGTILGASFQVLRRNPRPTFGVALLIQAGAFLVSLLLGGAFAFFVTSRIFSATAEDESTIVAGTVGLGIVTALVTVFLFLLGSALLQGIIVVEVARGTVGEKLPLRKLFGFARGRIWALVGWAAIVGGAMLVALAVVAGLIALLVVFLGMVGAVLGVLFGILAGLGLVVLGVWLGTKLSLVPSALVLEKISLRRAVGRSWHLTKDHFWRVFGIQLLVSMILSFASSIVTVPLTLVFSILLSLVNPNNADSTTALVWAIIAYIAQVLITVVIGSITAIVVTATSSLLYLDLRMRKEGLDLHLTRFVEARQRGADGDANPYLRPDGPTPPHAPGPTFA